MTFKPKIWYPIAAVLSVLNVVSVWFAAAPAEPAHATIHAVLAVAFGVWAQNLRAKLRGGELRELQAGLEPLGLEVDQLRQELIETQERLDFAERVLAQGRDPRRVEPDR
jgi:hypothetical protein